MSPIHSPNSTLTITTGPGGHEKVVIHPIKLEHGDFYPEVLHEPLYVYAIVGSNKSVALLNTGPAWAGAQLIEKLEEIGVGVGQVQRVILSNWDVRNLGNLGKFPNATAICLSQDRVRPFNFAAIVEHERHRLRAILDELYVARQAGDQFPMLPENEKIGHEMLDAFFADFYRDIPNFLPFIPVKNDDIVDLAGAKFTVIDHSPYHRGQLLLLHEPSSTLLGLATPSIGLPKPFYSLAAVIPMLDRLACHKVSVIGTNHTGLEFTPSWYIKRSREFVKSFIDHSPMALRKRPTLPEFVRQNFGFVHENLIDYLFELVMYQDVLNELARDEDIAISGAGIAQRRYGLNVVDTRHPRLQN